MRNLAIATEDELSESIALKLVAKYTNFDVHLRLRRGGFGYLRSNLKKFFEIAIHHPVLLITDLDNSQCAPTLRANWLATVNIEQPPHMLLRIAVREIESWILADKENFSVYIGTNDIPDDVEALADPKSHLLLLARHAPRELRQGLTARQGNIAIQGLEYNLRLAQFVADHWNPDNARRRCDSLNRTCERLTELSASLK